MITIPEPNDTFTIEFPEQSKSPYGTITIKSRDDSMTLECYMSEVNVESFSFKYVEQNGDRKTIRNSKRRFLIIEV